MKRWNGFRIMRDAAILVIVGAAIAGIGYFSNSVEPDSDITSSVRVVGVGKPIPKGRGFYRVGDPYVVAGRTYVPQEDPSYRSEGKASWYGAGFHGRLTANGEIFDANAITAAHPTLPLPSYARVTNLENNLSLVVRLNDRGPFHDDRLIDLSVKAAKLLGFYDQGLAQVRVEYLGPAELEGSNDGKLARTLRRENPSAGQGEQLASFRPDSSNLLLAGRGPSLVTAAQRFALDQGPATVATVPDIRKFTIGRELRGRTTPEERRPIEELFPKQIYD